MGIAFLSVFATAFSLSFSGMGSPVRGLFQIWNLCCDRLGKTDFYLLSKVSTDSTTDAYGLFLLIFLAVLIVAAWYILRSGMRILLLIYFLPWMIGMLVFKLTPASWACVFLAAALWIAASWMQGESVRDGTGQRDVKADRHERTANGMQAVGTGGKETPGIGMQAAGAKFALTGGIAALAAAAVIVLALAGDEDFILQGKTESALSSGITRLRYGEAPLKNGRLNSLDGADLKKERSDETALRISMESPQPLYLRGFVGEVYQGNSWEHLSNSIYYATQDRFYWIRENGFSSLTQVAEVAELTGETTDEAGTGSPGAGASGKSLSAGEKAEAQAESGNEKNSNLVLVQVAGADRSNLYLPYELTSSEQNVNLTGTGYRNCAESYLKPTGLFGARRYQMQALVNTTGDWTRQAASLYASDLNEDVAGYFSDESHYNVFAYEAYTQLSTQVRQMAYEITGYDSSAHTTHPDYRESIERIRGYLNDQFIYSDTFTRMSESADFAEEFVKTHKGTDVHFATLATILFRSYGIPARYVEGYLITPEDVPAALSAEATEVEVPFSRQHAWPEIYIDGYGWVPVEVTPGYEGLMPEADLNIGLESGPVQQENGRNTLTEPDEEETNPQDVLQQRILVIVLQTMGLLLLLFVIALLLFFWIRDFIRERKKRKSFQDPDPRVGVCNIYADMLREAWPLEEKVTQIGDRAAYSRNEIFEEERDYMLDEWRRNKKETGR